MLQTVPLNTPVPETTSYQAVIVTSAAAVRILGGRTERREIRLFVVGTAGEKAARECGFTQIASAADVSSLAALIRNELSPADGPLLYVAGVHRARDLRQLLSGFNIELAEVYEARKATSLTPAVRQALKKGEVRQIAFYSSRAAEAFVAAARSNGVANEARTAEALCLSPRIAVRLRANGWQKTWAARQPVARLIDAHMLGSQSAASRGAKTPAAASIVPSRPATSSSTAPVADQELFMSNPASHPPDQGSRPPPGWSAIIGAGVLAAVFAGAVWYMSNDRDAALQAEVTALRDKVASLNLDPGAADRAALAARAEEAAKIASALAGVAEKSAEQASVDRMGEQLEALGTKTEQADAAISASLDESMKSLSISMSAVSGEVQALAKDLGARPKIEAGTLEKLSSQVASIETKLAEIEKWASGAPPAKLAEQLVALSELRRVLDGGGSFTGALSRVQNAIPAAADASGWVDRASSGIPTYAQLTAQLGKIEKKLPLPTSNASDNPALSSALGVLLSGVQVEGAGDLVDDPHRKAVRAARDALAAGDAKAASDAVAGSAGEIKALEVWSADLAARMQADTAISDWENDVLATVGGSSK